MRPAADVAAIVARALGEGAYLDDVADGADGMVAWIVAMMALIGADGIEPRRRSSPGRAPRVRERGSPLEFGIVSNVAARARLAHGRRRRDRGGGRGVAGRGRRRGRRRDGARRARDGDVLRGLWRRSSAATPRPPRPRWRRFDEPVSAGSRLIPLMWLRAARALARAGVRRRRAALAPRRSRLGEEVLAAQHGHAEGLVATRPPRWPRCASATRTRRARSPTSSSSSRARWGTATEIGAALRLSARVDAERRLELLGEAIAVLERSPARLELARALVDLGEALRVARRRARRTSRCTAAPSSRRRAARPRCASARWRASRRSATGRAS